jgi:hypothetical protein
VGNTTLAIIADVIRIHVGIAALTLAAVVVVPRIIRWTGPRYRRAPITGSIADFLHHRGKG